MADETDDGSAVIPSISSGSVGSRFVSQNELDIAKANRDEQWKAAYARIGQEPPPQQEDTEYDGRSLYERLQTQKTAKQEEWDEKHKLSKQFRSLEADEVLFLDAVREEKMKEERSRMDKDSEEVDAFKQAVAAREEAMNAPPTLPSSLSPPLPLTTPSSRSLLGPTPPSSVNSEAPMQLPAPKLVPKPSLGKKDQKTILQGIVKKKTSAAIKTTNNSGVKDAGLPGQKRGISDGIDSAVTKKARTTNE